MPYRPDLSKVSIMIKTFLRDQHLACAIGGILSTMPEARIIVIDDGEPAPAKTMLYKRLRTQGHIVIELPFDSGFGAKSNAAAAACSTEYLLVGSDDFDFRPPSVRYGIEQLVTVLDHESSLSIASGRVNGNRYEGLLDDQGDRVSESYITLEHPQRISLSLIWFPCDLTVNYSLIRASVLGPDKLHWFEHVKIGGGEHGAWFILAKRLGLKVAWVPGVNIREQEGKPTDIRYHTFRGRARQPGREAFRAIGVKEYVLFDGSVERA